MSVRKATLGVMAALLKAFPDQAALAQLWVTSALPMVRDAEASLQEQLLDHVHTFLMVPTGRFDAPGVVPYTCFVGFRLSYLTQEIVKRKGTVLGASNCNTACDGTPTTGNANTHVKGMLKEDTGLWCTQPACRCRSCWKEIHTRSL